MPQPERSAAFEIVEALLTVEIYNRIQKLTEADLPPDIRDRFLDGELGGVRRPILIGVEDIRTICQVDNIESIVADLPFLRLDEGTSLITFTEFDPGATWFAGQDALEAIQSNPVLAHYFSKFDPDVSYPEARVVNQSILARQKGLHARIEKLYGEEAESLLKLVSIKTPEEVRNSLEDLVLTSDQSEEIAKAGKALEHRQYLKSIGLHEIGKILFVGPPGTGKTTSARALSRWFMLPLVEVRLSMIISAFLGETAKNIDSVFMLAKKLNPCILFIDEFDFVAKSRASDDHGAIKRAVNTLLKAIDDISLVEDGVLLIAATNYPQLLDHAAWRRFDKVMSFSVPDDDMRCRILTKVLEKIDAELDVAELAKKTEGFTGSDLRLVVREAVLNALLQDRKRLTQADLLRAVAQFDKRNAEHRQGNNVQA
ncbi:MAG: ATP-binding protein [Desulfobacteraceae bacterium]|nr:ATP-binding protein [Desulfobacteraceae bacterium]